jgi:hypothetical protein
MNDYAEFVRGKKIALVGPYCPPPDEELEQFDLVIRFNAHYTPKHRADIVYHNGSVSIIPELFAVPKWFVCRAHFPPHMHRELFRLAKIHKTLLFKLGWDDVRKTGLRCPTIGLMALVHLLGFQPAELHLLGQNLYGHIPRANKGGHQLPNHAQRFLELREQHENIFFSEELLTTLLVGATSPEALWLPR